VKARWKGHWWCWSNLVASAVQRSCCERCSVAASSYSPRLHEKYSAMMEFPPRLNDCSLKAHVGWGVALQTHLEWILGQMMQKMDA